MCCRLLSTIQQLPYTGWTSAARVNDESHQLEAGSHNFNDVSAYNSGILVASLTPSRGHPETSANVFINWRHICSSRWIVDYWWTCFCWSRAMRLCMESLPHDISRASSLPVWRHRNRTCFSWRFISCHSIYEMWCELAYKCCEVWN